MLLVKRKLSLTSLPCFIIFKSATFSLKTPKNTTFYLKFFSSASATQNPYPKPNFITDYLITSCGFSPERAATASRYITGINSPSEPDSVRHFLKHNGFNETDIRSIICGHPSILRADADKTMSPNLQAIRGVMDFSESELRRLIVFNPQLLTNSRTLPRLHYWRTLLNGDKKTFLLAFSRNRGLIQLDTDKALPPKFALLMEYGLSQSDIGRVLVVCPGVLGRSIVSLKALLQRLLELGFQSGSSKFVRSLACLSCVGIHRFPRKMEIFNSYGWSEREFLSAFHKQPTILTFSKKTIQDKMEFLVGKAGFEPSYIASLPVLLGFSLEKRLMPRYHIMDILKSRELMGRKMNLYSIMRLSEKDFVERIILPNMVRVPELHDTYVAACAGQIPL